MIRMLLLRLIEMIAVLYAMWITAIVLYEWSGWLLAIFGVIFMPISIFVMPVAMFFIPSHAAGALALWLPIGTIGLAEHWIDKLKKSGHEW
jgi:hypothetical protein